MTLKSELEYAIELARGAGKIVLEKFGRVARLTKRHAEAVTEADRATQRFIVAGLRKRYPGDGIVGEENDAGDAITFDCPDLRGRVWVIDPIDGTNNFIAGLPIFAVCIGLLEAGQPVLGVVYDVCRDLVWSAAKGHGAFMGAKRVHASKEPLSDSSLLMITSNLLDKNGKVPAYAVRWIGQTRWKLRCVGSAALEAVQVAGGIAHAALTVNGKLWDIAAPAAILLEAGGTLTSPAGEPIFPFDLANYDGRKVPFLAAAPAAHGELLEEMRQNP
jgi:fructose-1,6-bisphosphatase/inositol monophosphatase family enzyme